MFSIFGWVFYGIEISIKLIWLFILPIRLLSWISNIIINLSIIAIIIGIIALITGHIPDSYIQLTMNNVGQYVLHIVDPHGEKIAKIIHNP